MREVLVGAALMRYAEFAESRWTCDPPAAVHAGHVGKTPVGLKLTFACGPYDRVEPLKTGEVGIEGVDLEVVSVATPRELFDRVNVGGEFDVAEMSASEFISAICAGTTRHVAIPVFPSKVFRHGFVTINTRAGIATPKDLEKRRIGVPLYTQTAAIWIRGILEDEFAVDLSEVTWVQGAVEQPGSHGKPQPPPLLRPARIEINRGSRSLDELLVAGEIDALIGARLPPSLGIDPRVGRLFPDFRDREKDYFRRTGIHPIMHLVVIARAVHEAHPWLAGRLYDALDRAKNKAWRSLCFSGAQKSMLPWVYADIAELSELFGSDPWPYGIEANRKTLATLIEYMYRQYFIDRKPAVDDLFVV